MSREETLPPLPPQCPKSDDPAAWQAYSDQWSAYAEYYKDRNEDIKETEAWRHYCEYWIIHWRQYDHFFWRTEPEIDRQRKEELARRQVIEPDIKKGIYPFKDMKLTRADIEFLLATHENRRGPVNWSDANQQDREGLDLRGADLRGAELSNLPLARLRGGLDWPDWHPALPAERTMAAIQMERAILNHAKLEGAILTNARMEEANLSYAQLKKANLAYAQLKKANLSEVEMEEAILTGAQLKEANLSGARMKAAISPEALLEGANLTEAQLKGADLSEAQMKGANLYKTHLEEANLSEAKLEGAKLAGVNLCGEGRIGPRLADVQWGNTNLSVVKWSQMEMLGDEHLACHEKKKKNDREVKNKDMQLQDYYERAVRANRQLAVALQAQGLNEEAARFAYRAQKLQRAVFRLQGKFGKYLFFGFLEVLAGYGYRPGFTVLWYLSTLCIFTLLYLLLGHVSILGAFLLSLTSFHGRGFFPSNNITPGNPILVGMFAGFEAVIGLFIEISFIATFTQRFLGK